MKKTFAVVGILALLLAGGCGDDSVCSMTVCPGDCNGDGVISEEEVDTAVAIMGGELSLDECQAADVDGDGEVFGNEISAIVEATQWCR